MNGRELIFIESYEEFIKLFSNRKGCIVFITDMVDEDPLDEVSFGGVFGDFDGNVERNLMIGSLGVLFAIEKSEQSFREVVPLFGEVVDLFGSEAEGIGEQGKKRM